MTQEVQSHAPSYRVRTQSFKGTEVSDCETVGEVWDAIGRMSFGGIYEVSSPLGLDTSEFVPL